jgi:glycosyltransferase involved in cell wall biosynthesis
VVGLVDASPAARGEDAQSGAALAVVRASPATAPAPEQRAHLVPVPRAKCALIVSSFVLPHAGGVEQFVDAASTLLAERGWSVRILACRPPSGPAAAHVTLPTRFLPPGGWPVPVRGWRMLWREVGRADVVLANGTRQLLPNVAALAARLRRRKVIVVLHGSGAPFTTSSFLYHRLLGSVFEWLVARPVLRLSRPVSLSSSGVTGARQRYGVEAAHVPYPLRHLPAAARRSLGPDEPLRIAWVGRLYPEKNPLQAIAVVERVRRRRDASLHVYGSGILARELERLARDRPWLHLHGPRSWSEVQDAQAAAHLCLSTSLRDATQVAMLEPLARGIPAVSTRVGDAPDHYVQASLRRFCVDPGDSDAGADAILELASSYNAYREQFAANARRLRTRHERGAERLSALLETT